MDRAIWQHSVDQIIEEQKRFILKVYNWMCLGLFITGVTAYYAANSETLIRMILGSQMRFYLLIFGELGLVFYLSSSISRINAQTAKFVFLLYAALNGLTFSVIFLIYARSSISSTFVITSGTFAVTSLYGYTTKKDLTSWGSFFFMGLVGLIIASVVNIFMQSSMIYWVTTYIGVLVFVGLTVYDTQKIKAMNIIGNEGTEENTKEAILGALTLYLDFINLFLMLLRIIGDRRD